MPSLTDKGGNAWLSRQWANDMEVDNNREIECFRCGICCMRYQPKISPEELENIAGYLSLTPDEFVSKYVMVTKIGYLLRQSHGACIFLEPEAGGNRNNCSIHDSRPAPCRDWTAALSKQECLDGLAGLDEADRNAILKTTS